METKYYGPGTKEAIEKKLKEEGFRRSLNHCIVTTGDTKRDMYENLWLQDGDWGQMLMLLNSPHLNLFHKKHRRARRAFLFYHIQLFGKTPAKNFLSGDSAGREHGLVNDRAFGARLIDKSRPRTGVSPALAGRAYPKRKFLAGVLKLSSFSIASTSSPQTQASELRGGLVGAKSGLIFVRYAKICVLAGKTLFDQIFVHKKSVGAENVTQEPAILVAVGLRRVALQSDFPAVQKRFGLRRGFLAETLHRFARVNRFWRVDTQETDCFVMAFLRDDYGIAVNYSVDKKNGLAFNRRQYW